MIQAELTDFSTTASTVEEHATEKDWLEARRQGIGASEAPAVLGVSPWTSPMQLYAEKLQIVERSAAENEAMRWGRLLEAPIAEHYTTVTGRKLRDPGRHTLHRSRTHAFMVATLDREIIGPDPAALEIKTTGAGRAADWLEEPPIHVQVQVQHQLAVTGWAWASVAVLIGGREFRWLDVKRNDRFIALLIEREREFFARLQAQEPPEVDGSESAKEVLARLYPAPLPGLVVNLTGEMVEWDQQRQDALAAIKAAEAKKREAENHLRAAIAEAEVGVLPNGVQYSLRVVQRAGYSVEPTSFREFRRREAKA